MVVNDKEKAGRESGQVVKNKEDYRKRTTDDVSKSDDDNTRNCSV